MRVLKFSFIIFLLFTGYLMPLHAKVMYVTERFVLGVHTEPDEESPLLASISSGSSVEVLEENEGFNQVKLADGRVGWVSAGYLVNEEPSTAQLDTAMRQLELLKAKLKETNEKYKKRDHELQVRNDQLSNARTSIRELKKKLKAAGKSIEPVKVDTAMAEELAAANKEIDKLKALLSEEKPLETKVASESDEDVSLQLVQTQLEMEKLKARIDLALANLSGEFNPDDVEMLRLKPNVPGWIWALMVIVLIVGLILGILGMDYRVRQRHGGFRL